MPNEKGYERMHELTTSLKQAMGRLQEGKLGLDELEQCTTDARLLYERLVVLRHKLREAAVAVPPVSKRAEPAAGPEAPLAEVTAEPIRLDTRPVEAPVHQTSLIDAIAETEGGSTGPQRPAEPVKPAEPTPVVAAKPLRTTTPKPASKPPMERKVATAEDKPVTVADKLEHAPVADLRKAIALSQKFWFVAELFGGERERYEKAIDALNGMESFGPADAYLQQEVLAKLPKPPGEVAETFSELLKRRFRA